MERRSTNREPSTPDEGGVPGVPRPRPSDRNAVAARRELARRENIFAGLNALHLRCDLIDEPGEFDHNWRARGSEKLGSYEQVADVRDPVHGADRDDCQIIRVPGIARAADLPAGVIRRGVEVVDLDPGRLRDVLGETDKDAPAVAALLREDNLDLGDYDRLIPQISARASGHFSIAHTRLHAHYNFDTDYDPFSDAGNTDWTPYKSPAYDYYKSESGILTCKAPGGTTRSARYRYDLCPMAGVSADYSCDADVTASTDGSSRDRRIYVTVRFADGDNFYLLFYGHNGGVERLVIGKLLGGSYSTLGTYNVAAANWDSLTRLEAVGTTLKGYEDGAQRISLTDSSLSAAGYGAVGVWQAANASGAAATMDNFKVLAFTMPVVQDHYRRLRN